jgi:voltage-gated sodium channel
MTLESWSMGIVRPVMEVYPQAWLFFIVFILLTTFAVLNLFIAIVVDAMSVTGHAEQEETRELVDNEHHEVMTEIRRLNDEMAALRRSLEERG